MSNFRGSRNDYDTIEATCDRNSRSTRVSSSSYRDDADHRHRRTNRNRPSQSSALWTIEMNVPNERTRRRRPRSDNTAEERVEFDNTQRPRTLTTRKRLEASHQRRGTRAIRPTTTRMMSTAWLCLACYWLHGSPWQYTCLAMKEERTNAKRTKVDRKSRGSNVRALVDVSDFVETSKCHFAMMDNDVDPRDGYLSKDEYVGFAADLMPPEADSNKFIDRSDGYDRLPLELKLAFSHTACLCNRPEFGGNASDVGCCNGDNARVRIPDAPSSNPSPTDQVYFHSACSLADAAWFEYIKIKPTQAPTAAPTTNSPTKSPTEPPSEPPSEPPTGPPTLEITTEEPTEKPPTRVPTTRPSSRAPTEQPPVVGTGPPPQTAPPTSGPPVEPSTPTPSVPVVVKTAAPTSSDTAPLQLVKEAFVAFKIIIPDGRLALQPSDSGADGAGNPAFVSDAVSDVRVAMNSLAAEVGQETFGTTTTTAAAMASAAHAGHGNGGRRRLSSSLSRHQPTMEEREEKFLVGSEGAVASLPALQDDRLPRRRRRRLAVTVSLPTSVGAADPDDCPVHFSNPDDLCLNMAFLVTLVFTGESREDIDSKVQQYESNLYEAIAGGRLQQALDNLGTQNSRSVEVLSAEPNTPMPIGDTKSVDPNDRGMNGNNLSAGGTAGIVIAVLAALVLMVVFGMFVVRKRRVDERRRQLDEDGHSSFKGGKRRFRNHSKKDYEPYDTGADMDQDSMHGSGPIESVDVSDLYTDDETGMALANTTMTASSTTTLDKSSPPRDFALDDHQMLAPSPPGDSTLGASAPDYGKRAATASPSGMSASKQLASLEAMEAMEAGRDVMAEPGVDHLVANSDSSSPPRNGYVEPDSSSAAGSSGWSSSAGISSLNTGSIDDSMDLQAAANMANTLAAMGVGASAARRGGGLTGKGGQQQPQQQQGSGAGAMGGSMREVSGVPDVPAVSREQLDHLIESGDWAAVGATAALLAAASDSQSVSSRSRTSRSRTSRDTDSIDAARAAELDHLVDAGDWEGVVLAAAKFEAAESQGTTSAASGGDGRTGGGTSGTGTTTGGGGGESTDETDDSNTGSATLGTTGSPSVSETLSESPSKQRRRAEIRREVEALVRRVVPEEIENVDEMMNQFAGREEELVETLRTMQERAVAQKARAAGHKAAKVEARRSVQRGVVPGTALAQRARDASTRESPVQQSRSPGSAVGGAAAASSASPMSPDADTATSSLTGTSPQIAEGPLAVAAAVGSAPLSRPPAGRTVVASSAMVLGSGVAPAPGVVTVADVNASASAPNRAESKPPPAPIRQGSEHLSQGSSTNTGSSSLGSGGPSTIESSAFQLPPPHPASTSIANQQQQQSQQVSAAVSSAVRTRNALEQAIEAGDWDAVGAAAAMMSDASATTVSTAEVDRLAMQDSSERSVSSRANRSLAGINATRAAELDEMIDRGDWNAVVEAANRFSGQDGSGSGVGARPSLSSVAVASASVRSDGRTDEERDALMQADMWMKIATQSRQTAANLDAGASDAAEWAIQRSLSQLREAERQGVAGVGAGATAGNVPPRLPTVHPDSSDQSHDDHSSRKEV